MDNSGLLNWANSIRLTMASDAGRQVFKDQVHTNGFMFLEDYLDNIISGEKADPLIDLVKTPGRKKAITRKPKLMSSKFASNIFNENPSLSENTAPNNTRQSALQNVHNHKVVAAKDNSSNLEQSNMVKLPRSPFTQIQPLTNTHPPVIVPHLQIEATEHINLEHNDLSVIAEDDEPSERSRVNISAALVANEPPGYLPKSVGDASITAYLSVLTHEDTLPKEMDVTSSSTDTLHSIQLNSPLQLRLSQSVQESTSGRISEPSADMPSNNMPSVEVHDCLMADFHEENSVASDNKLKEKPMSPFFPTLPEPIPLRKSIRHPRDTSLNTVMAGAATPGAPIGGKRTSWLMKAREVKALEGPSKKGTISPSLSTPFASSLGQGMKRKSEESKANTPTTVEDSERQTKVAKLYDGELASRAPKEAQFDNVSLNPTTILPPSQDADQPDHSLQQGVLDRLKKTVEGLGVRVSKTMSKSVGDDAVAGLAEARAAAEAKVAERDRKEEEMTMAMGKPAVASPNINEEQTSKSTSTDVRQNEGQLSISDLFPSGSRMKEKHKAPEKPFQFAPSFVPTSAKKGKDDSQMRERTSTTPLHSPPRSTNQALPPVPVFNKPPPVFVPPPPVVSAPVSTATMPSVFTAPVITKYTIAPSMALQLPPQVDSPSSRSKGNNLSAQSTLESVAPSNLFDRDDTSPWAPNTQDTEYTQPGDTQICDEDDSWPIDEKLAAGVDWTYGATKDDSLTWSTLPSESQRGDTGPLLNDSPTQAKPKKVTSVASNMNVDMKHDTDVETINENRDVELEDIIMDYRKPTVSLVDSQIPRSQSQLSMTSSESAQSQSGFLGQASKLLSSALGTVKKKQPEVKKVLQMAASAAKKQQEEADKKAARLKEMENRRQQALQRKAEEEKAKVLEEERKLKEESERRKKEREDLTDKRSIKASSSKREEEFGKKGKEPEKKQEIKKPLIGKAHLKGVLKKPSTSNQHTITQPVAEPSTSLHKGKGVAQHPPIEDDVAQPSQFIQSQMAARAKAQLEASKHTEPPVPSESIELPDINSEYSDSEDEDRPRTFDPPDWAQSPELRQALEMQSTINPDDIFGAVRPLKMEEIFKTKTSRFRPRSSSANWTGTDRLTLQEEKEYARRMGFK